MYDNPRRLVSSAATIADIDIDIVLKHLVVEIASIDNPNGQTRDACFGTPFVVFLAKEAPAALAP